MKNIIEGIAINLEKGEIDQARDKLKTIKIDEWKGGVISYTVRHGSWDGNSYKKEWIVQHNSPDLPRLYFPNFLCKDGHRIRNVTIPLIVFAIWGPKPNEALALFKGKRNVVLNSTITVTDPLGVYKPISILDFLLANQLPNEKTKCLLRYYYAESRTPYSNLDSTKSNNPYQVFRNINIPESAMNQNDVADSLHRAIYQDINFSIELFSIYVNKVITTQKGHRDFFKTFSRLIKADIEKAYREKRDEFEQALQRVSDKDSLITWGTCGNTWHFSQSRFWGQLKEAFPKLRDPLNAPSALENEGLLSRYDGDVYYPHL